MSEPKPYEESDEGSIEAVAKQVPISQEVGGALAPTQPSAIESIDTLIAKQDSPEEVEKLLELRKTALIQKWQETQIEEAIRQQDYQRTASSRRETTITVASSGVTAIGLAIMYTSSPLVGTFVLIMGLSTLLGIPADEMLDKFIDFYERTAGKISDVFSSKP